MAKRLIHRYPGRIILASFLITIIIGTILLKLPFAQATPMGWLDMFFTSASATTVTGLLTVPISNFTSWGHLIILFLVQIGGLGLITMTLFFLSLFVDIGLTTKLMASEILEVDSIKDIKHILKFIIGVTFTCEAIGTLITFANVYHKFSWKEALFKSVFHAVSSFCNAGITLFTNGMADFAHNPTILLTTAFLAFMGGLGFLVIYELLRYIFYPTFPRKINLHTRIVLWTTFSIMIISAVLWWILEHNNTFSNMTLPYQILNAFFNSMGVRSTGYLTVNFNNLQLATVFMIMCTSFIGSSPGSTGSGIKTTTFAIFLATARAIVTGKDFVFIQHRKIKRMQVYRAMAIITIALAWIALVTFLLLITEKSFTFLEVFFETVSSFAVLGITSGITPLLTTIGKLFIISTMIAGRIGSLTLILAFVKTSDEKDFSYPEERVMLS